jgi:hypothetical protein
MALRSRLGVGRQCGGPERSLKDQVHRLQGKRFDIDSAPLVNRAEGRASGDSGARNPVFEGDHRSADEKRAGIVVRIGSLGPAEPDR